MSSGFVSSKVLDEKRKQRQEEWEKVRKPDEPELAPEEPHDSRSLFEQLEANKNAKQEEWDEARALKNQIRGIDDDEAEFLDEVDNIRTKMERERHREEKKELQEYRDKQAKLREEELEARLKSEVRKPTTSSSLQSGSKSSKQSKLLLGAVKKRPAEKKKDEEEEEEKKKAKTESSGGGGGLGALAGLGEYSSSDEES